MTTLTAAPPHVTVWEIASAGVTTRCLEVVADLGVADQIADRPVTAAELAGSCGVDATALERVMRLLAARGIFEAGAAGFSHNEPSRLLCSDHPMSMRAFARLSGLPFHTRALGALDHSVRTGATGVETFEARGFFAYLQGHPEEASIFNQAMTAKAIADISSIVTAYDFRPFRIVADVGGGRGHLLKSVLEAAPDAQGVLFDLPDVIATVNVESDRLRSHAGNFFTDPLPQADAYLLMEIIHDWPDVAAADILRAVRTAASPGATVLIIEDVAPESSLDVRSLTLDVLMLAITGGRERTPAEHGALLLSAGFAPTRVVDTAGSMRLVEGVAV